MLGQIVVVYVICMMGALSPGPDFFIIIKNSLQYQFVNVTSTALGIAVGCVAHVSFAIFGVAAFSAYLGNMFTVLKIAGACYLFYLGVLALSVKARDVVFTGGKAPPPTAPTNVPVGRESSNVKTGEREETAAAMETVEIIETKQVFKEKRTLGMAFMEGFLCNILNVKALIFFTSIFSQLIGEAGTLWLNISYVIGIPVTVFIWFTFLGRMLTFAGFRAKLVRYQVNLTRVMGVFLIAVAGLTLFAKV